MNRSSLKKKNPYNATDMYCSGHNLYQQFQIKLTFVRLNSFTARCRVTLTNTLLLKVTSKIYSYIICVCVCVCTSCSRRLRRRWCSHSESQETVTKNSNRLMTPWTRLEGFYKCVWMHLIRPSGADCHWRQAMFPPGAEKEKRELDHGREEEVKCC